jgi:hypothetical protein
MILGALLLAGGCARKQQQASLPPPPRPAPLPAPAPPPPRRTEPLSIPQTDVRLPAQQPIPEEALATIRTPPPTAAPAEPEIPKPARRVGPVPPPNVKLEPEPEPESPPSTTEPRIQALLSAEDRTRLTREIAARRRDIEKILEQLPASSEGQRSAAVERVLSFLRLSDQAAERGELRQANEYSNRALVLAKELVSGP